ncbi:DUF7504 family protein [Haladaptatus sp. NG-SE-30]
MIQTKEFEAGKDDSVLSQRPSEVITEAVTEVDNQGVRGPSTPLSDWIDPTALDRLFEPKYDGSERTGGHVSFRYENCLVTVVSSGEIYIHHGISDHDKPAVKPEEKRAEPETQEPPRISTTTEPEETVSQAVIAAVATAKGVSPIKLRQQLYDIVEPDALNTLFDVKSDRSSEPDGELSFVFDGCDVTVHSDGTIAVRSVFSRLIESGGNFLLVGDVHDRAFTAAGSIFFEPPFEARNPLLVFYGASPATARDWVAQLQLAETNTVVCDMKSKLPEPRSDSERFRNERSGDDSGRSQDARPVDVLPDSNLEAEFEERIDTEETPRLYFDDVETLVERRAPEQVESTLIAAAAAVTAVDGIGHYVLRASPGSDIARQLRPLFDGVIELRNGEQGIEQRWHLNESSYTTRWFGLE